jgi:hypothetical protein
MKYINIIPTSDLNILAKKLDIKIYGNAGKNKLIESIEKNLKGRDIPDEKMTYLRNVLFRSPHYCWKCKKYKTSIAPLIKKWS